ncbi:uncharacterized protein LOC125944547 [Dermacentor silvarum]|uniref:uncharacterized protein LOC125944547 n=1 Tax=Dermacentor silvarum TaxID=543639 RepID=UPI002100DDBC|nr:uncharacterized protein LOC125944547 [Dermacentor silvarum]
MEVSTQGGAPSMSELRGLGGTAIEPFERPVLSKEQVYAKFPHLAGLSTPMSLQSVQVSGHSEPPVPESTFNEKTKKDGSLVSSVTERSCKPRQTRSASGSVRHVVLCPKMDDSKGPQAADAAPCEEGCPCDDSCASREQLFGVSLPWSSVGSSLDALLSVPVDAKVYDCSSSRTETSLKAANELHLPVDKFQR